MSGRALQADLVPVLIGRLRQEPVLRGRPLEALAITRSTAEKDPVRTIAEFTVTSQGFPESGKRPRRNREGEALAMHLPVPLQRYAIASTR